MLPKDVVGDPLFELSGPRPVRFVGSPKPRRCRHATSHGAIHSMGCLEGRAASQALLDGQRFWFGPITVTTTAKSRTEPRIADPRHKCCAAFNAGQCVRASAVLPENLITMLPVIITAPLDAIIPVPPIAPPSVQLSGALLTRPP